MRYICPDYMFIVHPKSWNWDNLIEKQLMINKKTKKIKR
jgi:hypothetical protein